MHDNNVEKFSLVDANNSMDCKALKYKIMDNVG
jgi:hypothetical protein